MQFQLRISLFYSHGGGRGRPRSDGRAFVYPVKGLLIDEVKAAEKRRKDPKSGIELAVVRTIRTCQFYRTGGVRRTSARVSKWSIYADSK
ncbi:MAG TPA: hypothetical protein VIX17_16090 [Pyrinomonadaceae bacterium]